MTTAERRAGEAPPRATPWLAVVAYLAVLVVNGLATGLPLFGRSTGEISDRFPVLLTPAGFTFSVWGVIYGALAAFTVYQALPRRRERRNAPWLEPLRRLFIVTSVLNVAWLLAWHALLIEISLLVMLALLATLIAMYVRTARVPPGAAERWCVRIPVSLYLAWISVASLVNARVLLYDLGWLGGGAGEVALTVVLLLGLAALAVRILVTRRDLAYAAVIAWAAYGISSANEDVLAIRIAAVMAGLAALAGMAVTAFGSRRP